MKKKTSGVFSKTTVSCMQEKVLRQLVKIAGLHEMTIWRNRKKEWHLSVTVTSRPHLLTLSTRIEAALAAGQRVSSTRQVTLVVR